MATYFESHHRPAPLTGLSPRPAAMAFDRRGSLPTTMPQQSMEGYLSLPPDRGAIITRATWKTRFVVVGGAMREYPPLPPPPPTPASRTPSNRVSAPLTRVNSEGLFLSIYKTRSDTEPLVQYPISLIADCQVQMMSYRKQGPVLPTMVVNVLPDPQLEKARKRRSSRTAGLASAKDNGPITLLFRPADEHPTLNDWARFIQSLIQPLIPDRTPMSPLTPMSPIFTDPFSQRPREFVELPPRPGSGNGSRTGFSMKSSTQTYSSRERPLTFSDSPSLRSKRSDLSSQTSMHQPQPAAFHHPFSGVVPADLPSPATTIADYHSELIEGWTSAQGRSSALSSPVRGRENSVGSQTQVQFLNASDSASGASQAPRETILDRAFQLRCIPGAENEIPGEDKLSSLARFDALMKEMDEKRRQREAEEAKANAESTAAANSKAMSTSSDPKSAFDSDSEADSDDTDSDDDSDNFATDADLDGAFSTSTQRAFDYMNGKYERVPRTPASPQVQTPRAPPTYNHEAFMALSSNAYSSQSRPQTGYSKSRSRPAMSQRTHSQPHLATMMAGSSVNAVSTPADTEPTGFSFTPGSPSVVHHHHHHHRHASIEKRQSTSSSERLSFSEFTRRLSGASSLLGIQSNNTNNNAGGVASSRVSHGDMDLLQNAPQSPPPHLHHLHPRAGPQTPRSPPPVSERERCVWRGSVGVFGGGDGGFI
ncbi:hypothetical protein VTJ83DRAFT_3498 [Remersonia thermophila]|uniref:PH domain-containing protein n=1 Tax=Remersonia thermophila TaxID=72144 RepID=A0ABR4DGC1_9PEZI